jgi:hypothetical protein
MHFQLERDELDALLRAVDERDNLRRQLCAEPTPTNHATETR